MRAKKWLTLITFVITVISAVFAVSFSKTASGVWYDFPMAIFGSAFLGFIMSIIEYNVERRKAMESFLKEAEYAFYELKKMKYIKPDLPIDKIVDYVSKREDYLLTKESDQVASGNYKNALRKEKDKSVICGQDIMQADFQEYTDFDTKHNDDLMEQGKMEILSVIESYINAADMKLGNLGSAYGNLDFFVNRYIRKDLAYVIYHKICDYRNLALKQKPHFQALKEGKGNFKVCVDKACEICDTIFETRENNNNEFFIQSVYEKAFDEIDDKLEDFRLKIYYKNREEPKEHHPVYVSYIKLSDDAESVSAD